MAENQQSKKSTTTSVALDHLTDLSSLSFPEVPLGKGPKQHPPRSYDPRIIDNHFRPLMKNIPTAEERWNRKKNARPFLGV